VTNGQKKKTADAAASAGKDNLAFIKPNKQCLHAARRHICLPCFYFARTGTLAARLLRRQARYGLYILAYAVINRVAVTIKRDIFVARERKASA